LCAESIKKDTISQYLVEYINGKKTGNIMFVRFDLYNIKGKIQWKYTSVYFNSIDNEKATKVSVIEVTSEDKDAYPKISDISWEPGKSFYCKINEGKCVYDFKAIKENMKLVHEWNVTGITNCWVSSRNHIILRWEGVSECNMKYCKFKK